MKLSESQLREVYDILREKLFVMREDSTGMVGITPGNERYFPERNKIILGMPLASSKSNISLKDRPKSVHVTVGRKEYKTFSLLPLCEPQKIAALDINNEKKKSLIEKYKVKDEQSCVPVLKTFHIHLPYYKNYLNYGEIITRLTLELYEQYLNSERAKVEEALEGEHFSSGFKAMVGKKMSFKKSHEQHIEKQFFDFLKSFDAIEVTSWNETPLISTYKGFENFDERLNYASYDVSFWRFPVVVPENTESLNGKKVDNIEKQFLRIKRAVFNKANIKYDDSADIARLPLVSCSNGKDNKTV